MRQVKRRFSKKTHMILLQYVKWFLDMWPDSFFPLSLWWVNLLLLYWNIFWKTGYWGSPQLISLMIQMNLRYWSVTRQTTQLRSQ
jgi:hypothetical protein